MRRSPPPHQLPEAARHHDLGRVARLQSETAFGPVLCNAMRVSLAVEPRMRGAVPWSRACDKIGQKELQAEFRQLHLQSEHGAGRSAAERGATQRVGRRQQRGLHEQRGQDRAIEVGSHRHARPQDRHSRWIGPVRTEATTPAYEAGHSMPSRGLGRSAGWGGARARR